MIGANSDRALAEKTSNTKAIKLLSEANAYAAKKRAEADAIYSDYYVYRINQYDLNGYKIDSMFYYFYTSTDTLFEVNSGSLKK